MLKKNLTRLPSKAEKRRTRVSQTRLLSKAQLQIASGQGSHWLIDRPICNNVCEICVNFIFVKIFMLLAFTLLICSIHTVSTSTLCV